MQVHSSIFEMERARNNEYEETQQVHFKVTSSQVFWLTPGRSQTTVAYCSWASHREVRVLDICREAVQGRCNPYHRVANFPISLKPGNLTSIPHHISLWRLVISAFLMPIEGIKWYVLDQLQHNLDVLVDPNLNTNYTGGTTSLHSLLISNHDIWNILSDFATYWKRCLYRGTCHTEWTGTSGKFNELCETHLGWEMIWCSVNMQGITVCYGYIDTNFNRIRKLLFIWNRIETSIFNIILNLQWSRQN